MLNYQRVIVWMLVVWVWKWAGCSWKNSKKYRYLYHDTNLVGLEYLEIKKYPALDLLPEIDPLGGPFVECYGMFHFWILIWHTHFLEIITLPSPVFHGARGFNSSQEQFAGVMAPLRKHGTGKFLMCRWFVDDLQIRFLYVPMKHEFFRCWTSPLPAGLFPAAARNMPGVPVMFQFSWCQATKTWDFSSKMLGVNSFSMRNGDEQEWEPEHKWEFHQEKWQMRSDDHFWHVPRNMQRTSMRQPISSRHHGGSFQISTFFGSWTAKFLFHHRKSMVKLRQLTGHWQLSCLSTCAASDLYLSLVVFDRPTAQGPIFGGTTCQSASATGQSWGTCSSELHEIFALFPLKEVRDCQPRSTVFSNRIRVSSAPTICN